MLKKILFLNIIILSLSLSIHAQDRQSEVFVIVEEMPMFPGCENSTDRKAMKNCSEKNFQSYIDKNTSFPQILDAKPVKGTVMISFIVKKDGSIEEVVLLRDPGMGYGEAIKKTIEEMNRKGIKYVPGKQRGRVVDVKLTKRIRVGEGKNEQKKTKPKKIDMKERSSDQKQ